MCDLSSEAAATARCTGSAEARPAPPDTGRASAAPAATESRKALSSQRSATAVALRCRSRSADHGRAPAPWVHSDSPPILANWPAPAAASPPAHRPDRWKTPSGLPVRDVPVPSSGAAVPADTPPPALPDPAASVKFFQGQTVVSPIPRFAVNSILFQSRYCTALKSGPAQNRKSVWYSPI